METVNIHSAKTNFSNLVDMAALAKKSSSPKPASRLPSSYPSKGPACLARRAQGSPRQPPGCFRGQTCTVRILLDTHILVWWLAADRRLPREANRLITGRNGV